MESVCRRRWACLSAPASRAQADRKEADSPRLPERRPWSRERSEVSEEA